VARERGAHRIARVKVRVGDFSGVVPAALEFAFDALKAESLAAGAALEIERVPIAVKCPNCGSTDPPAADLALWCTQCTTPLEILAGQELDVQYIDVEEE
jgi:hydrogenase nickel incorporation protein HypA/HybF